MLGEMKKEIVFSQGEFATKAGRHKDTKSVSPAGKGFSHEFTNFFDYFLITQIPIPFGVRECKTPFSLWGRVGDGAFSLWGRAGDGAATGKSVSHEFTNFFDYVLIPQIPIPLGVRECYPLLPSGKGWGWGFQERGWG